MNQAIFNITVNSLLDGLTDRIEGNEELQQLLMDIIDEHVASKDTEGFTEDYIEQVKLQMLMRLTVRTF